MNRHSQSVSDIMAESKMIEHIKECHGTDVSELTEGPIVMVVHKGLHMQQDWIFPHTHGESKE